MSALEVAFDLVLTSTLIGLAVLALSARNLVMAICAFIALGLSMTIAWVRLAAPDVALAEAGIGTGLTGALLFAALARLRRTEREESDEAD